MKTCKKHPDAMHLDGTNYCYKCGVELLDALECENCGQEVMAIDVYCPFCGIKRNNPPIK